MEAGFLSLPARTKRRRFSLVFMLIAVLSVLALPDHADGEEKPKKTAEVPLFIWDLLWTGSWYNSLKTTEGDLPSSEDLFSGGTLFNRGNMTLVFPCLDLSLRYQATDKRLLPPEADDGKAGFNPALGMYHNGSGSRLLVGVQSEYGLPARINNVWLRSAPFIEARVPSSRDLKNEPAAKDTGETYLYLALPYDYMPGFGAFASAALDKEQNPAFGAGFEFDNNGTDLWLEGFYTQKELQRRKISTWFSSAPPLPERDFRIYALGMNLIFPQAAFAADWALSETFAWGRGMYGNFALRLGNKPWRFSLAGDGALNRFADRSGAAAGEGFRIAAKGERFWTRSGFLRFQGILRSPGPEEPFNRANFSFYFRPSAPTAADIRNGVSLFRFSRASFSFNRDARNPQKTADTMDALAGFYVGPLSAVFSYSLHGYSSLDSSNPRFVDSQTLFQPYFFEDYDSYKVSGELGVMAGIFNLKTRLSYTDRVKKPPLWEPSLNCSVKPGKWGRLTFIIASADFPKKWNYTVSWRFEYSGKY